MTSPRRRRPEPTQPGNPHGLTIRQHVHSAACIRRFADDDEIVAVLRLGTTTAPFPAAPDNPIFCAARVWSQQLETSFCKRIEDRFQQECDRIAAKRTVADHAAVTEYLALWETRAWLDEHPPQDAELRGISPQHHAKAQEEALEAKHVGYLRGTSVPGRLMAHMVGIRQYDDNIAHLGPVQWGVITARGSARLLCSDRPARVRWMPIDPRTALVGGYRDLEVPDETIEGLNRDSVSAARRFVFGHPADVRRC